MQNNLQITCPKCNNTFQLEEVYKKEIEAEIVQDFNKKLANATKQAVENERKANEQQKSVYQRKIDELFSKNLELEQKNKLNQQLELKVSELQNANKQIQSNVELEIQKAVVNREKELQNESENKINEWKKIYEEQQRTSEERVKIQAKEDAQRIAKLDFENKLKNREEELELKYKLELKEKDEKLQQANKKAEELTKNLNQVSMQVQGEAQEKFLTDILQELFPDDKIERKTTGAEESDIKQIVINKVGYQNVECGVIQYESKNTKTWSNAWIDKLIADGETAKADILVLVTQTMPANNRELHRVKNVWVCPFKDIKIVSNTLRHGLIKFYEAKGSQINKADKMEQLFDFMMSPTFKNYIENIYTGISNVKQSYEKEKKALETIWKKREKEFENIMYSCTSLVASIQSVGIETLEIEALDIKALASQTELEL